MSCFDKSCRFGCRQVDSTFDAIKGEPNHVLLACLVPIAQIQFLVEDGFLFILMTSCFRLGRKGMDPMNGCLTDYWDIESRPTTASWQNRNHQHTHGGA
jgi:hypothetical protein